jgi:hypothetical protein
VSHIAGLNSVEKRQNSCPCQEFILGRPARILFLYKIRYPGFTVGAFCTECVMTQLPPPIWEKMCFVTNLMELDKCVYEGKESGYIHKIINEI